MISVNGSHKSNTPLIVSNVKLLLMGSGGSGKTTMGKVLESIIAEEFENNLIACHEYKPTPGVAFYKIPFENIHAILWELGGQKRYRPLWNLWWAGSKGAFLLVDSTASSQIIEESKLILKLLKETINVPFVVCANKQDLPAALKPEEIAKILGIENNIPVIGTSSITGLNVKTAFYKLLSIIDGIGSRKNDS